MSHQTGIKANDQLLKVFGKCKEGKIRIIKISIENEELSCAAVHEVKKSWEKDYDKYISPLIQNEKPCYVLYRLDEKTPLGYGWLLLSWIPDSATVREKMLYASTKATLKTEFGSAHIKEELHASSMEETTLEGYFKNKKAFAAPAPLTTREEELNELKKTEVHTEISIDTRHQTLGGLACPWTEETTSAVKELANNAHNYLQFKIEIAEEKIHVVKKANISLQQLPKEIPTDCARYHIYLFKYTHEGDYQEAFVFIYSMPGYSCPVKERMMYSSCKLPFLEAIQSNGIEIAKKLEIDDGKELTEEFLKEELHPTKCLHRPQFAKPKGPPNRGAKRMTRPQNCDQ